MGSKRACRLCLYCSEDFVDVFQDFEGSTIAATLTQHFWFQIYKDDGFSECLCQECWTKTKSFHHFYKKVETRQKNYFKLIGFVEQHNFDTKENETTNNSSNNVIKLERSGTDTVGETNEYIVKTEEVESAIAPDLQIQREESVNSNYDPSESADSEDNQTSHDDEQSPKEKLKLSHQRLKTRTTNPSINCQTTRTSVRDTITEDAQIREFFKMECEICSDKFETFVEVKNHYRLVHKTGGYLTCCEKKFRVRGLLMDHIRRHLNPDAYRCDTCGKRFANRTTLKNHIENHKPFGSRAYKCSMCSSSFTKSWKLANHERLHHCSEENKKFHCDQCNKNFASKSILAYHIRSVHEFGSAYVCDICAKVFKTKQHFTKHMQQHATVNRPKVQCNVCGARLKHAESLHQHMKLHQYTCVNCPTCDKVLKNKESLYNHNRDVHGERSHQCTMCDKAFRKAFVLKEHMATHTGEVLYKCPYCTKPFRSRTNMYQHRKKDHFAEWSRDRLERFAPITVD